MRKTDQKHWDENWRRASAKAIGGGPSGKDSYVWRRIRASVSQALHGRETAGLSLIEVGAGGSEWLPLLARDFDVAVAGLDYSPVGCSRAREVLAEAGVDGCIYEGDMFDPPAELAEKFDIAASFGLVEHFQDTAAAVAAIARFVRRDGVVLTAVPNMAGLYGWLYRLYDKRVFDMHVALTLGDLTRAHEAAGLRLLHAEHLFGLPGVYDVSRHEPVLWRRWARRAVGTLTQGYQWIEERGFGVPPNAMTSPYLLCVATKSRD